MLLQFWLLFGLRAFRRMKLFKGEYHLKASIQSTVTVI